MCKCNILIDSLHFDSSSRHHLVLFLYQFVYFFLKFLSLDQILSNLAYYSPIWHFWFPLIVTFVLSKNFEMLGEHRRREPILFYNLLVLNFLENFTRLQRTILIHLFNPFFFKNSELISHVGNLVPRDTLWQIVRRSIFQWRMRNILLHMLMIFE